jgi:phenylalanyl-tRNA synthetase beta chain
MAETLRKLDFEVSEDMTSVTVPFFRDDVRCMNDLAEEIIRMYGYNEIQSTLSNSASPTVGARTERQSFDVRLHDMLVGMGFNEIETFSFISPSYYDKIRLAADDSRRSCVVISNPLGEDTSVMRTTALPSMLKILADNYSVKNRDMLLFENAKVYLPTTAETSSANELPEEPARLTLGFISADDKVGFYRMKGYVEAILAIAGISNAVFKS